MLYIFVASGYFCDVDQSCCREEEDLQQHCDCSLLHHVGLGVVEKLRGWRKRLLVVVVAQTFVLGTISCV